MGLRRLTKEHPPRSQSATIKSLPRAFRMMEAMQAQGVERGEDYRFAAADALKSILRGRMAAAVDRHLAEMAARQQADWRNGCYSRHLLTKLGDIELQVPRTRSVPAPLVRPWRHCPPGARAAGHGATTHSVAAAGHSAVTAHAATTHAAPRACCVGNTYKTASAIATLMTILFIALLLSSKRSIPSDTRCKPDRARHNLTIVWLRGRVGFE